MPTAKKYLATASLIAGLILYTAPIAVFATTVTPSPTPAGSVAEPTQIVPECNPALPPSAGPGPDGLPPCGLNKFLELIQNIIKYITYISFPLAALMIGWGGIQIMTAAGSTEKISKGWSAIKISATGIAIILVSFLIVQAIFKLLEVDSNFTPNGL
jgi:hypothetical protein